jgi:multidrug efflux pump subunit AcrB
MMGKLNKISRCDDVLAAVPGTRDQHRRHEPATGPVRFHGFRRESESGLRGGPKADGQAARVSGFSERFIRLLQQHAQLNIDIKRDQAKTFGVSEARILTLLRNAYSQNYLYLIKKPEDQYQVILEMDDSVREKPEDLSLLYIKSDDGRRLVPLSELVTWKSVLGPQVVNHLNQFTSMTLFFNLKPGVALGDCDQLHHQISGRDRSQRACARNCKARR